MPELTEVKDELKENVLQKIKTFYSQTGRVPVSKDYREDYGGSGLPHWQTVKKHFPAENYDEVINQAIGFETFSDLLFNCIKNKKYGSVLFVTSSDLSQKGHWASTTAISRWLSSNEGNVVCGYHVGVYTGGTREHGKLFKLTKMPRFNKIKGGC